MSFQRNAIGAIGLPGVSTVAHLRQNPRDFSYFCRDQGKKWRECWWFLAAFVCSAIKYI
jgi:hypothetical protein